MGKMGIGLQMYTLREEAEKDFTGTLKKVAEIGYEGVEFAGYGGLNADQLADLLQQLNLKAIASHVSLERLTTHLDEEIDFNLAIGSRYIICPYVEVEMRKDEAQWLDIFAQLQPIGRRCFERGIGFGYHNHEFELLQKVKDAPVLDAMMAAVPAETLQLELDACWVHHAGAVPADYIVKYAQRLPLLHLKDMRPQQDGGALTVELGQGVVDLKAIIAASAAAQVEWLIVEQDKCENPPIESITESLQWVRKNYNS
ncbi:MAG: sugar phosphate isomerase [Bacilli bacterium]|nr:sugar phosphate isomerase [Bacilli bacterium]